MSAAIFSSLCPRQRPDCIALFFEDGSPLWATYPIASKVSRGTPPTPFAAPPAPAPRPRPLAPAPSPSRARSRARSPLPQYGCRGSTARRGGA